MQNQNLNQVDQRKKSLKRLLEIGINPYPSELVDIDSNSTDIKDSYDESSDERIVKIAGRLMRRRIMGKASFAEIQDDCGRIQLYLNRDEICKGEDKSLYNEVFKKLIDIGDIIFVRDSNTPTMNIVVVLSNTGTVVDVSDGTAITVADAD